MMPNSEVVMKFEYQTRKFGEAINQRKYSMRGGYKKRGRK